MEEKGEINQRGKGERKDLQKGEVYVRKEMAQGLGGTRDVEAEREGKQASTAKKGVLEERKEEVEE